MCRSAPVDGIVAREKVWYNPEIDCIGWNYAAAAEEPEEDRP